MSLPDWREQPIAGKHNRGSFDCDDAKTERAAKWDATYGAVPLLDAPGSPLLPLSTIQATLAAAGKL